jgi:hypothetical protein
VTKGAGSRLSLGWRDDWLGGWLKCAGPKSLYNIDIAINAKVKHAAETHCDYGLRLAQ